MSLKRLIVFAVFVMLLAGVAFFLNNFNENQLLQQNVRKIWNLNKLKLVTPQGLESYIQTEEVSSIETEEEVSPAPILTPTPTPFDPYANDPDLKDAEWGKAVQVSETGWRMKVGFDAVMSTPDEAFAALNHYRYTKGKSNLTWDGRLAAYALERASFICRNGSDGHEGFKRYVNEEEGYKNLGFYWLGENMSTHMRFTGTHLIEWMYAADPYHDGNQLGDWSHVGVGIFEDCSALIFGNKMI